jgi:hypothetical protein
MPGPGRPVGVVHFLPGFELVCRDRFEEGSLDVIAFFRQPAHLKDDRGRPDDRQVLPRGALAS